MMSWIRCGFLALLASALIGPGVAAQELPGLETLLDYLDELYRSSSSHAVMTMTVERERGTRELTLESWSQGEDEALIVIREPAREAGTATLRTVEGLWNYAPRADRLIRIPTGLLSERWMGSHFTNDDLVRETSYLDDYQGELDLVDVDATPHLRVQLAPRPSAPVVYTRIVFLMAVEDWTPVRADYYDDQELVRTMSFEDVRAAGGKSIPHTMVLIPQDDSGERTIVHYQLLELDVAVDPDLFTRRGLRRIARP